MISKERKNEILNLMIDWLDYHDLPNLVDDVMSERDDVDKALSAAINHIDEHIHDIKDKLLAWQEVIGLTKEEMIELDILEDLTDQYNDDEEALESEDVYENEEEKEDTITVKDGKIISTSVGNVIDFGEVLGFIKVKNTTYLVIKDKNSLKEDYNSSDNKSSYDIDVYFGDYLSDNDDKCSLLDYVKYMCSEIEADMKHMNVNDLEEIPRFNEVLEMISEDAGQNGVEIEEWNENEAKSYFDNWYKGIKEKYFDKDESKRLNEKKRDLATDNSIYVYSIDTSFPFKFNKKD